MKSVARKTPKPPSPLEKDVQRIGIELMEGLGIQVHRRNVGGMSGRHNGKSWYVRFAEPGQSDTWGILPDGRHVEVEFKRPDERPTLEQTLWLIRCSARCPAFWVDNVATLGVVIRAVLTGATVVYRDGRERYGKVWGPSADYDLYRRASQ